MSNFLIPDYIAFFWFFLIWFGYNRFSDVIGSSRINLFSVMAKQRTAWMRQMLARDNRMVDMQILHMLTLSASFFASTSILVLAGLIAVLGATDKVIELIRDLPFSVMVSRELWEFKIAWIQDLSWALWS